MGFLDLYVGQRCSCEGPRGLKGGNAGDEQGVNASEWNA